MSQLKGLERLRLGETKVSDKGIEQLQALENLTHLYLGGTRVSHRAAEQLKKTLPKTLDFALT